MEQGVSLHMPLTQGFFVPNSTEIDPVETFQYAAINVYFPLEICCGPLNIFDIHLFRLPSLVEIDPVVPEIVFHNFFNAIQ